MLNKILNLIKPKQVMQSAEEESKDVLISSIALLLEVAKSDANTSGDELKEITALAVNQFEVNQSQQDQLLEIAKDTTKDSTSLYQYTSLINDHYSAEKKYQLIYSMWCVAYADGRIDRYEEHLIRKVSDLIYVPHVKFIEAKLDAAKQHE